MRYRLSFLGLLFSLSVVVNGQDCNINLDESRRAYYDGKFNQVISLLKDCVEKLQSNSEKAESLELLSKSSLMLNENEEAEKYMKELLTVNPLFVVRESELIVFKNLYKEFEIRTRFNVGAEIGGNLQQYTVLQYHSYAGISSQPKNYDSYPGISFGVFYEYFITRNLLAGAKFLYQTHSYKQSGTLMDYQSLSVNEKLTYLNVPLQLKYQINKWGLKPFFSAGVSLHYLTSSKARIDLFSIDQNLPIQINPNAYSTSKYDLSDQRKKFTCNYAVGGGVKKPFGLWSVQLEFQYEFGLNNLARPESRYSDPVLLNTYSYVSNDFKMDHFRVTAGIVRSFVYPKKIKR
jgi:hypothetical protein